MHPLQWQIDEAAFRPFSFHNMPEQCLESTARHSGMD